MNRLLADQWYKEKNPTVDLGSQYGFGNIQSLGGFLTNLIQPAFEIAAAGVTFYFLFAAFKWISSGGDKQAISDARGMITHSIIGFLLLMLLFLVIMFIQEFFGLGRLII